MIADNTDTNTHMIMLIKHFRHT